VLRWRRRRGASVSARPSALLSPAPVPRVHEVVDELHSSQSWVKLACIPVSSVAKRELRGIQHSVCAPSREYF
jgi:hypothetical protein